MIEMEFIGGPFDGNQEIKPEEIKPTLHIPAQPHGYYQLCEKANEEVRPLTTLHLSPGGISELYHYLWITRESRGRTVNA